MAGSVTLNALEIQVQPEIERSESDLKSVLDTIKSGGEVDAAKLLYYTTEVNKNSLTINVPEPSGSIRRWMRDLSPSFSRLK